MSSEAWSGSGFGLIDRLAALAGYPEPDAALEERLRAAGLMRELSGLGARDSGFLPIVNYAPSPSSERIQQLARLGVPAATGGEQAQFSGELTCEIEMHNAIVPTPDGFRQLLDIALRVVQINAEANPPV